VQHRPNPVLARERDPGDGRHIHRLARQQNHLRPPPRHDGPRRPANDPEQPVALLVAQISNPDTLSHRRLPGRQPPEESLRDRR
jgi:hypothetical protein